MYALKKYLRKPYTTNSACPCPGQGDEEKGGPAGHGATERKTEMESLFFPLPERIVE